MFMSKAIALLLTGLGVSVLPYWDLGLDDQSNVEETVHDDL